MVSVAIEFDLIANKCDGGVQGQIFVAYLAQVFQILLGDSVRDKEGFMCGVEVTRVVIVYDLDVNDLFVVFGVGEMVLGGSAACGA